MAQPAPIRLIEFALKRLRYPIPVVGLIVAVPLITLFITAGGFKPLPSFALWSRPMEIMGLFILFTLLPACLLMWFTAWLRFSDSLFEDIRGQVSASDDLVARRYKYSKFWPIVILLGAAFAVFGNLNLNSIDFDSDSEIFFTSIAMATGQIFMWSIVALTLFFVLCDDMLLYHYGKSISVNIYDLDVLNGYGRAVLRQFLMVIGALGLTFLQSLDREFQWVNYANALYVGVPSALIFVFLPTWTIRRNIREAKKNELQAINAEISLASSALDDESLARMNRLLVRREQVQHFRTWPMDISIFVRFLFYILIVPLAWLGAALMEVVLDSFLAG